MDAEFNTERAEFMRLTVTNFRFLDPLSLQMLATDLKLALSPASLARIQHAFRVREMRDITTGELLFLDALARLFAKMPGGTCLDVTKGAPLLLRSFGDVFRKWATLGERVLPTLPQTMDVLPRYLERSGVRPYHKGLYCGRAAELSARCKGDEPLLALELSHTAAALIAEQAQSAPKSGLLLLLSPTGDGIFADEVAAFLAAHRDDDLHPLALPGEEGLLPHLLQLDGVMLDSAAIPQFNCDLGPASLLSAGKDALLLLAPERAVSALFSSGAPLSLIGSVAPTGKLQIHHGAQATLCLDISLLHAMRGLRTLGVELWQEDAPSPCSVKTAQNASTLLCGVECDKGSEQAMLALFTAAARQGADLSRATLTAALELPPQEGDKALSPALCLLLGYHRAAAELAMPAVHHRQILTSGATPHLSVYLAAPKGVPRDIEAPCDWQAARESFFGV